MSANISKYVQLNSFVLLEYEFNRDAVATTFSNPYIINTLLDTKYFYEGDAALGVTNNILPLNSVPTNIQRTNWYLDSSTYNNTYPTYWDSSISLGSSLSYTADTIKLHIVSGYNFDDIGGLLVQIRALDTSSNLIDLANFTYAKQPQTLGSNVVKFSPNTLFLGNRFYDKYIEFKVPSVQTLGSNSPATTLGNTLSVVNGSDVYITYSTIVDIVNDQYIVDDIINAQLPVTSVADNFDCFIAESSEGDYIEYYATWDGLIIGNYMGDIESGRIRLYTSNNPNDNYNDFIETYGESSRKWVVMHEITVYEQIGNGTSLLTQKYSFTQDGGFISPNYFRPILKNADIAVSYTIQYVCRLMNRMDGTQIIRRASFSSTNPKKYGLRFTRLNVDNIIPYKVFNRIEEEKANTIVNNSDQQTRYVKAFYDTTTVAMTENNELYPQGTGMLFLRSTDFLYKFKFEKYDKDGNRNNVDLSGSYSYILSFILADKSKINISPTYSINMNTTLGELEFKITEEQIQRLMSQEKRQFSINVQNPNGSSYVFYEGTFYSYANREEVMNNYNSLYSVSELLGNINNLEAQVSTLEAELAKLKTT